tara:strand:- start:165 stop:410 length:246 start_codon:yes stop_codon:yes gene_type:complete
MPNAVILLITPQPVVASFFFATHNSCMHRITENSLMPLDCQFGYIPNGDYAAHIAGLFATPSAHLPSLRQCSDFSSGMSYH